MSRDQEQDERMEAMFASLCAELGFCLHSKGQKRVIEALPLGLDAAVKAVFQADGMDIISASGDLKRAVRDCLKAHVKPG